MQYCILVKIATMDTVAAAALLTTEQGPEEQMLRHHP